MIKSEYLNDWNNEFLKGTGGSWYLKTADSDGYTLASTHGPEKGEAALINILDNDGLSKNGAGCGEDVSAVVVALNSYKDVIGDLLNLKARDREHIDELDSIAEAIGDQISEAMKDRIGMISQRLKNDTV